MSIRTGYSAANLQIVVREHEQEVKALQAEVKRLEDFNVSLRNALEVSITHTDELETKLKSSRATAESYLLDLGRLTRRLGMYEDNGE